MGRKITVANEQAFQSIYLDPSADRWQDVIVFHEPVFDEEISGVVALKSLRLEDAIGFVIAAPSNVLRLFKEKVKELDDGEQWGRLATQQIVNNLMSLAVDLGASIAYQQNMKEFIREKQKRKKEEAAGPEPESGKADEKPEAWFDHVTKRNIVEKGVHYFDPSLPVMDEDDKAGESGPLRFKTSSGLIYSPAEDVYPEGISEAGRPLWRSVVAEHKSEMLGRTLNRDRWAFAKALYADSCRRLQIEPYRAEILEEPSSIWKEFKERWIEAVRFERDIVNSLYASGVLENSGRMNLEDAGKLDNSFFVTAARKLRADPDKVMDSLAEHGFADASLSGRNAVRRLSGRTLLTARAAGGGVVLSLTASMPCREAEILYGTGRHAQLVCRMVRGTDRMLKIGQATQRIFFGRNVVD